MLCITLNAQEKKYIYTDSTLTITDEVYDSTVVQAPVKDKADDDIENVIEIDTTVYYNQLTVSPDSIAAWKNLKGFAYVKYLDSLLKAKKDEQGKKQETYTAPSGPGWLGSALSSQGLQVFLWALAILFVLFILYKLFLTEGVFRKNFKNTKTVAPEVAEEIITGESDFYAFIKDAEKSGNYRLAVRYHYLQSLHKLADKNMVQLAADKTNYQYVREIANQNYQNNFAALTLNYEYVWYGEFAVDENIYRKMEPEFSAFNNKL